MRLLIDNALSPALADLGQVVENIARTDVAEIKAGGAPTGRKRLGLWAALPGALAGGMIGGAVGQGLGGAGCLWARS